MTAGARYSARDMRGCIPTPDQTPRPTTHGVAHQMDAVEKSGVRCLRLGSTEALKASPLPKLTKLPKPIKDPIPCCAAFSSACLEMRANWANFAAIRYVVIRAPGHEKQKVAQWGPGQSRNLPSDQSPKPFINAPHRPLLDSLACINTSVGISFLREANC